MMRVSLEAPRLQPSVPPELDTEGEYALGKVPQLWRVEDGGELVFKPEDPNASLSARLQRVWAERGDFSKVTLASLGEAAPVEEDPVKAEGEELSPEELWKLKTDMLGKLETARVELSNALDLVNLVLPEVVQTKPSDPAPPEVPLPYGTLTSLVLDVPLAQRPAQHRAQAASTAYASKQVTLKKTSNRLLAASKRLSDSATLNEQTWRTWLGWADAGRVEARGARRGAGIQDAKALERTAKEVVTFFGCEEAAEGYRGASYANLDAQGTTAIPPRSRGRRRLLVKLRLSSDGEAMEGWPSIDLDGNDDFAPHRREVFDEELFAELVREASGTSASVVDNLLALPLAGGGLLSISIDTFEDMRPADSAPLPSLVSAYLRLRLIALYRRRRSVPHPYTTALQAAAPTSSAPSSPAILQPMLDFLALFLRARRLLALLQRIATSLPTGEAEVTTSYTPLDLDAEPPSFGLVASLRLPLQRAVHARLSSSETAVALDLTGGRRAMPSTMTQVEGLLQMEVQSVYASVLANTLGADWRADGARARCDGPEGRSLLVRYSVLSGLDVEMAAKRYLRDREREQSLIDWVCAAVQSA